MQKEKKQSEGRLSWKYPIVMMLLMAFILEATGVNTGAYVYGGSLIKILGVPLYIPIMWSVIMTIAYIISRKYGVIVGVLSAYSIDLLLEPLAFYTGAWTWLNTFSAQVYFNSTVANAIVWLLMCLLGVYLWRKYSWRYDELKNKIPRPLRA
ncbi:unnamed protein product [marine sediment metagenome]|uniref:Uncharacterized protein n=1 Tax=marine sediment metagenome TaxID=412755 RepID=X1EQG2_9ZZZZ